MFNGWFPELARPMQAGPPGGPDAAERAKTRGVAVAVARAPCGKVLAEVEGPSPSVVTAELMAMAAHRLALGLGHTPGVVGPIDGLGADEFPAAGAEIGLARV